MCSDVCPVLLVLQVVEDNSRKSFSMGRDHHLEDSQVRFELLEDRARGCVVESEPVKFRDNPSRPQLH